MRIARLDLIAFGPFRDRQLDLAAADGGLQVVYGRNEAGKSSSLRGLKALLFGIPARTPDNFVHPNAALRIGGLLVDHRGRELALLRRKGNRDTLLSPAGEPLGDDALDGFLRGVNAEMFDMLFGIDHATLVQGGREILQQKGEVGQALFAASLGSAALHGVLERFDRETAELFKPKGQTQGVNAALMTYRQIQAEMREHMLSTRDWAEAQRALEVTERELDAVQDRLRRDRRERHRLRRIQRALPRIAAWRAARARLQALGEVVELPVDFGTRRQAVAQKLETAQAMAAGASANLAALQQQLDGVTVNGGLLEQAGVIEQLHAQLGGQTRAVQERPRLEAELDQLTRGAAELLRAVRPDLGPADVEALRPVLSRGPRIAALGNQRQALIENDARARNTVDALERRLAKRREERLALAAVPHPGSLAARVAAVRRHGDLDVQLSAARAESEVLESSCRELLSRLGAVWQGGLDDVAGLPLPARETIARYEQLFLQLDQRVQRLAELRQVHTDAGRAAQRELDVLQQTRELPSAADLAVIRDARDRAWRLLRSHWLQGVDVDGEARELDPQRSLPDAFEFRLREADQVADRLRREAESVQRQAALQAALDEAREAIARTDRDVEAGQQDRVRLEAEWRELWQPGAIRPLPPREMRGWLDEFMLLRERLGAWQDRRRHAAELESRRDGQRATLVPELQKLGADVPERLSMEVLLAEAEAVVTRLQETVRQRELLDVELAKLSQELEAARNERHTAHQALQDWQSQWFDEMRELGLDVTALPAEAADVLENTRGVFERLQRADELRTRIRLMEQETARFHRASADLAVRVAPELAGLVDGERVLRLNRLRIEADKAYSRRQQLEDQIRAARDQLEQADVLRSTMNERLDALCQEARCGHPDELEQAVRNADEVRDLKARLALLDSELVDIAEGLPRAELEAEADGADPDALDAEIEQLGSAIDEVLEPRKTALAVAKGERQKELALMDGRDDAATLAEQAQSLLAEIRDKAEQYVRLKLAAHILREEIERYRRQHQGPVLARAGELFGKLTRGSFSGLRADINERDEPVLVGVRPDDARVDVAGMSSGTRDQLYLALRLASLEKYMENAEPMPFIVDDILVHFDDDRSAAALAVLAGLARSTQVILFTHHHRVVEQAQALGSAAAISVHEL